MQTHTVAPRPYSSHHHYYYFVSIFQMFYGRNKQKNTVQNSRKRCLISASHIVCMRIWLISLICCRFNWKWQLLNIYRFLFISRLLMITMMITKKNITITVFGNMKKSSHSTNRPFVHSIWVFHFFFRSGTFLFL